MITPPEYTLMKCEITVNGFGNLYFYIRDIILMNEFSLGLPLPSNYHEDLDE